LCPTALREVARQNGTGRISALLGFFATAKVPEQKDIMSKSSGRRTRRLFNPEFKAKVALAALREDKTLTELCQQYELRPTQITEWKKPLLNSAAGSGDT